MNDQLSPSTRRCIDHLDEHRPPTPCLVLDPSAVRDRYHELRSALPGVRPYYAVKACPEPAVIALLIGLGCRFDVASPGEIDLCLRLGAAPETISYGNTIKKPSATAHAYAAGVRLFVTDSEHDLRTIAERAPGSSVVCRLLISNDGADMPFGRKFGATAERAVRLLRIAPRLGLRPLGLSFHVGSQQCVASAWAHGVAAAARVAAELAGHGIRIGLLNLGGGLPISYRSPVPTPHELGAAILSSVTEHFADPPALAYEPGRVLVAAAGLLRSEVVLVSRGTPEEGPRWVYLDAGRYNGLAETENEYVAYRLRTPREGGPTGPVVLAGPTCDGDDVIYQRTVYHLPLALRPGDHVDFLDAGAYTFSYASVWFNGFPPMSVRVLPEMISSSSPGASSSIPR
jgi:ornithine decarboxylase